ncbi:hypothetical protein EJB05_15295, partial [Eragrostis curvula]
MRMGQKLSIGFGTPSDPSLLLLFLPAWRCQQHLDCSWQIALPHHDGFGHLTIHFAVYAVEFSHGSGRDFVNIAKMRIHVTPIIDGARHPAKYRMLVGMVDVIFSVLVGNSNFIPSIRI